MNLSAFHKKIKAFTLLELLVGMILSGIVLTATFSAYRIVTSQYQSYRKKSETLSAFSFFISQFQADFSNATAIIHISENEIQLNSKKKILDYHFSEKYVLRNDLLRTDTFPVTVTEMETFRESEKIIPENEEADEIHLQMDFGGKKLEKIYQKSPSAENSINKIDLNRNGN
jgi:prepilin-type N-terminal cleavage/methylation domain-containing protein